MSEVSADIEEVVSTVQRLQHTFEDLVVGRLQFLGPQRLPVLEAMQDEFQRIGADHLTQRLGGLIDAIRTGPSSCGSDPITGAIECTCV